MKVHSFAAAAYIGFIILLLVGSAAECAELKVLAANGIQAVVEDLGPKFERGEEVGSGLVFQHDRKQKACSGINIAIRGGNGGQVLKFEFSG